MTDSPAATRKVVSICRALRSVGVNASIVSLGRSGGTRSGRFFPVQVGRLGGIPIVYGPVWDIPIISQLVSAFWIGGCSLWLSFRRGNTVHLFYNQASVYILAMSALRLRGVRSTIDIEDGPISNRTPAYSRRWHGLSPKIVALCVQNGALLANSALAHGTQIRPTMVCFGAVPSRDDIPSKSFGDSPLIAVFAGYLNEDTGLIVLREAIEGIRQSNDPLFDQLRIEVAGMGPGHELLREYEHGRRPEVCVLGRLDEPNYGALLRRAHIGLSLKPIDGDIAESTFPSKTVEYAQNGLALIATDVSDVRALFGNAALYLKSNKPEELIGQLRVALLNRPMIAEQATLGARVVADHLGYETVGRGLAEFLFRDPKT